MNKLLITFFMINISSSIFGAESPSKRIQVLPSHTLEQQFIANGHADFAQNSDLLKRIGGKDCDSIGLGLAISSAITNYQLKTKNPISDNYGEQLRNCSFAIIFRQTETRA